MLIREILTRYGRNNIGFLWLFVEPITFILLIAFVWTEIRGKHLSNIPIVAFAISGYASMLMWRHSVSRCIGAVKSNKALLYHRQVTVMDIFTARILLEVLGMTTAFWILTLAFYTIDWVPLPENLLQTMGGWGLIAWFGAALAMLVGGLAEKFEVVSRIWAPISYIMMALSGVAFTVDALPPSIRPIALWNPVINALEYLREGWFGSVVNAHYDIPYVLAANTVLTLVGFSLVRQISTGTSEEE
jgi:ABC-2 type transport system permease protein/capsular polysaccharide transport system permease protein